MKIISVVFVVSLLLLTACAPKVSDEDVKTDLSGLSDGELDAVIADAKSGDGALAGQATMIERGFFWRGKVSARKVLEISKDLKIERLEKKIIELEKQSAPIESGTKGIESPIENKGFNPEPEPPAIE